MGLKKNGLVVILKTKMDNALLNSLRKVAVEMSSILLTAIDTCGKT